MTKDKQRIAAILTSMVILFAVYFIYSITTTSKKEGLANFNLNSAGDYPHTVDDPILDSFKHTGHKYASNDNSSGIWWYYPTFEVGSYEQITNNLRYRNNPDEGTCSRADMCGALYRRKKNKSNITVPLSEAKEGAGSRVNYYRAKPNTLSLDEWPRNNDLAFSIPTNENILF